MENELKKLNKEEISLVKDVLEHIEYLEWQWMDDDRDWEYAYMWLDIESEGGKRTVEVMYDDVEEDCTIAINTGETKYWHLFQIYRKQLEDVLGDYN